MLPSEKAFAIKMKYEAIKRNTGRKKKGGQDDARPKGVRSIHILSEQTGDSAKQIQRYLNKISGPLLDRIDMHVEVESVPFEAISKAPKGESSATIRERVIKARNIQANRFLGIKGIHCNAQMTSKLLQKFAVLDDTSMQRLRTAMQKLNLSARAYDRILKVARTIADLDGSESILSHHIAEAIGYRSLDRENWIE